MAASREGREEGLNLGGKVFAPGVPALDILIETKEPVDENDYQSLSGEQAFELFKKALLDPGSNTQAALGGAENNTCDTLDGIGTPCFTGTEGVIDIEQIKGGIKCYHENGITLEEKKSFLADMKEIFDNPKNKIVFSICNEEDRKFHVKQVTESAIPLQLTESHLRDCKAFMFTLFALKDVAGSLEEETEASKQEECLAIFGQVLSHAKTHEKPVFVSLSNPVFVPQYKDFVMAAAESLGDKLHVFGNDSEMKLLCDVEFDRSSANFFVTNGANPTKVFRDGQSHEYANSETLSGDQFVDGTGNGDAFMAGVMSVLLQHECDVSKVGVLEKAMEIGHLAGLLSAKTRGARLSEDNKEMLRNELSIDKPGCAVADSAAAVVFVPKGCEAAPPPSDCLVTGSQVLSRAV